MTLPDQVLTDEKRPKVVADCQVLLERQVASKRGISGFAVKAGFKVVKKLNGGRLIPKAINDLLPEFTEAMEPFHARFRASDSPSFAAFVRGQEAALAAALLSVTDGKAVHAKNAVLKGVYNKLRPAAQRHIEVAVPELTALIDKHTA
jgi:hypothetical protein